MQVPLGHTIVDGKIIPADWSEIVLGSVMMVRWPHMLLAAFLTTGMCVAATGAWYVLRNMHRAEARVMLHWGLGLRRGSDSDPALLRPPDGSLRPQASAGEVRGDRGALEDAAAGERGADGDSRREGEKNLFAIEIPKLGSMIASGNWTAKETGLEAFRKKTAHPW
jgi:cytochrome d ubiquinol oxidase subunit I